VQRVVYAFILIIILAFLGGFPAYLAVGWGGGSQNVTITVTAQPVYSPSTGGGGGGAPPTPLITNRGVFTKPAILYSDDRIAKLSFDEGTVGRTKDGVPLRQADTMEMSAISIRQMENPPPPPEDACIVGVVYDIGPGGATFSPPITLTIECDPLTLPEDVAEQSLYIAYWDGSKWVTLTSTVDTTAHTVSCQISHFTTFAVIGNITPPAPAAFSVSNLSITPLEVKPKEAVAITVSVANTGGTQGSYTVVLKINGVKEAEKSVTVAVGKSQDVTFSVTKEEAGSYSVAVDGLTGSFTVAAAPPQAPPAKPPVNWPLIGGIIAGVVIAGLIVFFLVRRRAY